MCEIKFSKFIDHTLLKPSATKNEIKKLCQEALHYNFMSVCINPIYVSYCSTILKHSDIKICTVIGFPLGVNTTKQKMKEAIQAINDGANEIDMVMNIGYFKDNNYTKVKQEIDSVISVSKNNIVKVIIETDLLNRDEIIKVCQIIEKTKTNFIKTSTGFYPIGATINNIDLIKKSIQKKNLYIKASGGIKSFLKFKKMIDAGATRIGTSSSLNIMNELK